MASSIPPQQPVRGKELAAGLAYSKAALEANPNHGHYWLSYIDALIQSGQSHAARQVLEQGRQRGLQGEDADALARRLDPSAQETKALLALYDSGRYPELALLAQTMTERLPQHEFGWMVLGTAFQQMGRSADALAPMRRAAALSPSYAEAQNNLGNTLKALGRLGEAEASFRRALQIKADYVEAQNNLGTILQDLGSLDAAEASYRRALEINPDYAKAHNNLANILKDLGRLGEAEASYRIALEINPDYAEAYCKLGALLQDLGRLDAAEASYRRALETNPDYAKAHNNLGSTLYDLGRLDEAEASFRRALQVKPDYAETLHNLGQVLRQAHHYRQALLYAQRAVQTNPAYAAAYQGLATMLGHLSDYAAVTEYSNAALKLCADDPTLWEQRLYIYSYHPDLSAEEIYAEFVRWGDRFPSLPADSFPSLVRDPVRRLRVGYVSPDFRKHTSRFFFEPLFAHHDKSQVELFAYSNVLREDSHTECFKKLFDHWRPIRGVSDQALSDLIRCDQIDILVDACNHMMDHRLGVFVLKPAPIQVTWLGAAWTTGLPMVDYVLFDHYLAPEGTLAREQILRQPGCFVAYRPPAQTADVTPPPALRNGFITFGYTGRTERLNHKVFRAWAEILRRLPEARLLLDYGPFADPPTQTWYRELLASHGVDVTRVAMRRSKNIFAGLADIDILLDCFPHSGGTMLFDALWMGVPFVTFASRPPVGRIGTSLMCNLGLANWVSGSETEYIDNAVAFAGDIHALTVLRASMRSRMRNSPIMDEAGFARGVESAYRHIWQRWCAADGIEGCEEKC